MGIRRRTRRRALVAGAVIGHHGEPQNAQAEAAPGTSPTPRRHLPAPAPPPPDPNDQIEHLARCTLPVR